MLRTDETPLDLLARMDCLADETRLRLLRLIENQELAVIDLCDVLQMPQSTVSRHLKLLTDHGWCHSTRQGTTNLYCMLLDELEPAARRLWQLTREQTRHWPTLHQDELRLQRRLRQRQEQSQSQAFFAGSAGQWDQLRRQLYGSSFDLSAQLALLPRHWVLADLGCGAGNLTATLSPHVQQVIGVDESEPMLDAARQRTAGLPNVDLRLGALDHMPIDTAACDGALLVLVLTYLAQPLAVLREMARILRPGGAAVVVDLLRHDREEFRRQLGQQWPGFEQRALSSHLREAGFTDITWQELPPEPDAKGPALFLARAVRDE